jgi:23S rRNA (uracil1939-C5)-methyltransferase
LSRARRAGPARASASRREACAETWTIEKLVPGGSGFSRTGGVPGFAEGAFPGDRLAVEEREVHAGHVRATRFRLLEPGPERVEAACPVADACGGCDWMRLSDEGQIRHKGALVQEALLRTAGIQLEQPPRVIAEGPRLHYRNRIRLHVSERGEVGFHARGSNAVVSPESCAVATPAVDAAYARLQALARTDARAFRDVEQIELVGVPETDDVEITLRFRASALERDKVDLRERIARVTSAVVPVRPETAPLRTLPLPFGVSLQARAGAFTQVNWSVNRALVTAVVEGARERGARTFVDLYAGSGNFSLPLTAVGLTGVAVEAMAASTALAETASKAQRLEGLEVIWEDVVKAVKALVRRGRRFDLAVLDPPRAGAKEVVEPLVQLAPTSVAYVACDPVTLARDVKLLHARGYTLESVTAFDMFPQTHHVEVLAWLTRSS